MRIYIYIHREREREREILHLKVFHQHTRVGFSPPIPVDSMVGWHESCAGARSAGCRVCGQVLRGAQPRDRSTRRPSAASQAERPASPAGQPARPADPKPLEIIRYCSCYCSCSSSSSSSCCWFSLFWCLC